MRCDHAQELIEQHESGTDASLRQSARQHVESCADCRAARDAVDALRREAELAVPAPTARAFGRAMKTAALAAGGAEQPRHLSFWSGAALGGALAATLVYAAVTLWPTSQPTGLSTPTVVLAAAEVRDVAISVYSEKALSNAEIHVSVTGAIGLDGFAGQRELRWTTELDRGINQLNLPLIALGAGDGQLIVDVSGGGRHKSFLVDVQTAAASADAG